MEMCRSFMLVAAAAVVALGYTSCSKDEDAERVNGAVVESQAVEKGEAREAVDGWKQEIKHVKRPLTPSQREHVREAQRIFKKEIRMGYNRWDDARRARGLLPVIRLGNY